ncbi:hypothetical protein ACNOYE_25335 [Nannocystaceae bacterium ST9]
MRPAALALLGSLALACDDGRGPLELDELIEPEQQCVTLVHESLDLDGTILAFASDAAGSTGGWALISTVIEDQPQLAVVRVPASADEPETALLTVSNDPFDAPLFHLRAGLESGSAWLLRDTDDEQIGPVVLRKLIPGVGEAASNGQLANFPADESGDECPDAWARELVLIEGRPYMLAIPDCAAGPSVELQLLELDGESLAFLTNWTLAFDPCEGLDPQACANAFAYRLDRIGSGQSTHLPGASRVAVGFTQVRAFDDEFGTGTPIGLSSDISVLDLRADANGPDARLLTFREVWVHTLPFPLGEVELAQDPYSLQIFVPNLADRSQSALVRLDTISDFYLLAMGAEILPNAGQASLIQLARESTMIWLDEGRLDATSLIDVDVWGSFESQTIYAADDLIGFESAGPGMLLLHRSEHPDALIHVACLESP